MICYNRHLRDDYTIFEFVCLPAHPFSGHTVHSINRGPEVTQELFLFTGSVSTALSIHRTLCKVLASHIDLHRPRTSREEIIPTRTERGKFRKYHTVLMYFQYQRGAFTTAWLQVQALIAVAYVFIYKKIQCQSYPTQRYASPGNEHVPQNCHGAYIRSSPKACIYSTTFIALQIVGVCMKQSP